MTLDKVVGSFQNGVGGVLGFIAVVVALGTMLGKLLARLKENPDNPQGWVMLARSYRVLGRFAEAARVINPRKE